MGGRGAPPPRWATVGVWRTSAKPIAIRPPVNIRRMSSAGSERTRPPLPGRRAGFRRFVGDVLVRDRLQPYQPLLPRRRVDERIRLTRLAGLELDHALEGAAVGIGRHREIAVDEQSDLDVGLELRHARNACLKLLAAFDAVTRLGTAEQEGLVRLAAFMDRELERRAARRVAGGDVDLDRRLTERDGVAILESQIVRAALHRDVEW